MTRYPYTLALCAFLIGTSSVMGAALLLTIGVIRRSLPLILSCLAAVSLFFTREIIVPQHCFVRCENKSCQWALPSSLPVSFLLRDLRAVPALPDRAGWYHNDDGGALKLIQAIPEHSSMTWATTEVLNAAVLAQPEPGNILVSLFGRFGLAHLLCMSAWHVRVIQQQKLPSYIFSTILLFLLYLTYAPFPLLRAVIGALLPGREMIIETWSLSWLLALLLSPFAWTTWSFWLSFYYSALFFYSKPSMLLLRLSNLLWLGLWGMEIDAAALIIGMIFERVFLLLLVFCWLSYPALLFFPELVEYVWDAIFSAYLDYTLISHTVASPLLPVGTAVILFFWAPARQEKCFFQQRSRLKNDFLRFFQNTNLFFSKNKA